MFWVPLEAGCYDPDATAPWFALPEFAHMFVRDDVRKCVLFLGTKEKGKFRPRATAFVVSMIESPQIGFRYLVTAEHVIVGLQEKGKEIWVRSNLKNGTTQENPLVGRWWFHPDNEAAPTDVAVVPIDFSSDEDFLSIPLAGTIGIAAPANVLQTHRVGVGHEVFITGLFRTHYGNQKNVPIVRVGNIAMMRGEPVKTEYCGYTDAYLIEARSIGGLSGSPVFVNIPVWHTGALDDHGKPRTDFAPFIGDKTYLLGLMHGHFDIQNLNDDVVTDDEVGATHGIHTGIGVVIPVEKILETIHQPEFVEMRKAAAKEHFAKGGAKADVADAVVPPDDDANPNHLADFTRLVDVAARKRPQGDQT